VSIDEVRQRQAQLRAMRELMFRQDQKAKRIAKIKSKAYRKIHKRERERELERRIAEEGSDGEDAREKKMKIETARARERMTLRHKNTGDWARRMLNRGQHDLETRQAISEQVRRGDELQRKILGDDQEDGESDSAEELDDLLEDPNKWGEEQGDEEAPEIRKGVLGMKFMRDAEERQKQLNAEQIAEIKAAVDAGSDDDEIIAATVANTRNVNLGRKTFTPGDQVQFHFDFL
jgi:U3 small nucleolar RNA-associated protein 14